MKTKPLLPATESFSKKLPALSPRDFVTKFLAPKLKDAPDEDAQLCIDAFAGLFSGIPGFYDFQVQVPEWVRTASKKFWDYSGVDFAELQNGNQLEFARIIGLIQAPSDKKLPREIEGVANELSTNGKAEAAQLPTKNAREFFTAVEKGEDSAERLKDPAKRIKIFMLLSTSWHHVESLESAGQLHRWLLEIDAFNGEKTDAAETRKICRIIGLRLRDEAGRPPK